MLQQLSKAFDDVAFFWVIGPYFFDGRQLQNMEKIIEACLATQNRWGGFGVSWNSNACEDIDSIDPAVRLSLMTDYRRDEIRESLEKALIWLIVNQNDDGGWVFKRGEIMRYGHELMTARANESAMFPTWFGKLSLALLSKALPENPIIACPWRFVQCPGHQFWR